MTSRPPGGDDGVAKIAAKARSYVDLFSDLSNFSAAGALVVVTV